MDVVEINEVDIDNDSDCEDETVTRLLLISKILNKANYLTCTARLAFTQLRQAFIEAPSFWYFDFEYHIWIQIDVSSYAINRVLSQLTLNNLGWWHLVVYYLQKMILAKNWYKTHNGKLLGIVEAFKTWKHYIKGCKHEIFFLIDYNNFQQFMDTKSLSSCQVC